ncbi:DUF6351 family protein [Amycolatopsis ultiminotia]|uniref:DUF6351 family protein n=1 Tax=Amycolatopsis ultiminotia TaxID=543629 RepID=UPI0031E72FE7
MSNPHPELVSGGEVLVRITAPVDAAVRVTESGREIGGFARRAMESYTKRFGRDPDTGFVRSPLDNVGVRYGLAALERGQITASRFVAVNAGSGGYDGAGKPVPSRTKADPRAVNAAYRGDILSSAGQGLRATPIIDARIYPDSAGPLANVHTARRSFVLRDRLVRANGTAANQVIIESRSGPDQAAAASACELAAMDQWLTAVEAGHSSDGRQTKVGKNKPAGLGDGCYLTDGNRIELTYPETGRCGTEYPVAADTRWQAGEPLRENVLKSSLRPVNFADYPVPFTRAEQCRANATAAGVPGRCV